MFRNSFSRQCRQRLQKSIVSVGIFLVAFIGGCFAVNSFADWLHNQPMIGYWPEDGEVASYSTAEPETYSGVLPGGLNHENEEPSLRVEYVMTVPTPEGLQARFLLSNLKREQGVLLSLEKDVRTIPCVLREHHHSRRSVSERVGTTHCEVDKTWLDPLGPRSDESYVALGVPVESLSDQLELTFDYFDGARPDRHRITVNVDKQDYATLYK